MTATNAAGTASTPSAVTAVVAPDAPANTTLPSLSGTARDGQTLTATDGTWTGTPTITYAHQWQRCNPAGASCANIAGATQSTYTQVPADVGSTLRDVVTATNAGGSVSASSAPSALVAPDPPANSALPAISGTTTDANVLTASPGTWSGTPTLTYAYQWQRCNAAGVACADIAGATASTHTLIPADVGGTMRVVVAATNAGGTTMATSPATATVAPAAPVNTVPPAISGTATDEQALTISSDGTWTGTPTITYAYKWQRCDSVGANCADIAGATSVTYLLAPADVGKTVRGVVTATNAGGSSSASSDADRRHRPGAARQHDRAGHLRDPRRRRGPDRHRRLVERHADDHLLPPVEALRRVRRELRRHPR